MGYGTHLNEQKISSQHMSRIQCLLRYGRSSCGLYSRCSMWFPCVGTQVSALRCIEVVEKSWFQSNLLTGILCSLL
jgi:hypothetical protein